MKSDIKGSSFFFPSKGFFGGVQRRSANGYPNVRSSNAVAIVRTETELRQAVAGDVGEVRIDADIVLPTKLIIARPLLLTCGAGYSLLPGVDYMDGLIEIISDNVTISGVNIGNDDSKLIRAIGLNGAESADTTNNRFHSIVIKECVFQCGEAIASFNSGMFSSSSFLNNVHIEFGALSGADIATYRPSYSVANWRFLSIASEACIASGNQLNNNDIYLLSHSPLAGNIAIIGNQMGGGDIDTSAGDYSAVIGNLNTSALNNAANDDYVGNPI